jgi:hypothetical protein
MPEQPQREDFRSLFPQVCKWYREEGVPGWSVAEVNQEIAQRARRLQEAGISPCHECPLCPGEHPEQ